jgi:uncharacterized protein (DUF488 family)
MSSAHPEPQLSQRRELATRFARVAKVFTIGHSTHEPERFAQLLGDQGVEMVVDVRRYPGSRRVPWTGPGEIERALPVDYLHMPGLGGRRAAAPDSPNGFWENDGFRGYADHMASGEFSAALERLLELAAERRLAVMCAEGPWWRCHRRLLADVLVIRGCEVFHIDTRGRTEVHQLTKAAVVDGTRIVYPPVQEALDV